jgi:hypothetical protein
MQARLLHPISIEVEKIQRAVAPMDPDYSEPIQQAVRGPRIICPGQVQWGMDERLRATLNGAEQESEGYVLFLRKDLRAVGLIEIAQNDRFTSFGSGHNKVDVDLYVVGLRYQVHYPDSRGAQMVKAFFKDRFPSKQNRGGL